MKGICLLIALACALPSALPAADSAPSAQFAYITLYRRHCPAKRISWAVYIDAQKAVSLHRSRFATFALAPGVHYLSVIERIGWMHKSSHGIAMTVKPGEHLYVRVVQPYARTPYLDRVSCQTAWNKASHDKRMREETQKDIYVPGTALNQKFPTCGGEE